MGAIFKLAAPIMGQTHGMLQDRYQLFTSGGITITYLLGTLDKEKNFVLATEAKIQSRGLSGAEKDAFLKRVEDQGAPEGEFRDADVGVWIAKGPWTPPVVEPIAEVE